MTGTATTTLLVRLRSRQRRRWAARLPTSSPTPLIRHIPSTNGTAVSGTRLSYFTNAFGCADDRNRAQVLCCGSLGNRADNGCIRRLHAIVRQIKIRRGQCLTSTCGCVGSWTTSLRRWVRRLPVRRGHAADRGALVRPQPLHLAAAVQPGQCQSVGFVSDAQLKALLATTSATPAQIDELMRINQATRIARSGLPSCSWP